MKSSDTTDVTNRAGAKQYSDGGHAFECDQLWNEGEVANYLGLAAKTLRSWRTSRSTLPFLKIGRLVRYRRSDVEAFVNGSIRNSTSDKAR